MSSYIGDDASYISPTQFDHMTFDPNAVTLKDDHLNSLAQLLHETGLEYIEFTGAEIRSLTPIETAPKQLTDFKWNLTGAFIAGTNDNTYQIISPALLLSEPVPDNTWFDHAETAAILNYIRNRLGDDELLNKIQLAFADTFDYLSQGQAKSVIKRYLGLTLSSSERNDIYRLRKKIEGYWQIISAFEDKLAVNRSRPQKYADHDPTASSLSDDELIEKTTSKLAFMCWECKTHQQFPEGDVISPPIHHDEPMVLNWNVNSEPEEITAQHKELEETLANIDKALKPAGKSQKTSTGTPDGFPKLYCKVCHQYKEIDDNLQKRLDTSDHRIDLPTHHNQEMTIVTRPVEDVKKLKQIAEKHDLFNGDYDPGLYFVCTNCFLLLQASDIEQDDAGAVKAPIHHNQKMKPMYIPDKKSDK